MITTITTTTTTTVVMLQQGLFLGAFAAVALIALLVTNELLSSSEGNMRLGLLAHRQKIVILPLTFAFFMIVVMKIWEIII